MGPGEHGAMVTSAARLALAQWSSRLGVTGTAAMRVTPGLVARVDQHAAAIRDAIADRHGWIHPVALAAYADGVADTASAQGWSSAEIVDGDWSTASWPSVRLLAVCALARATG